MAYALTDEDYAWIRSRATNYARFKYNASKDEAEDIAQDVVIKVLNWYEPEKIPDREDARRVCGPLIARLTHQRVCARNRRTRPVNISSLRVSNILLENEFGHMCEEPTDYISTSQAVFSSRLGSADIDAFVLMEGIRQHLATTGRPRCCEVLEGVLEGKTEDEIGEATGYSRIYVAKLKRYAIDAAAKVLC